MVRDLLITLSRETARRRSSSLRKIIAQETHVPDKLIEAEITHYIKSIRMQADARPGILAR